MTTETEVTANESALTIALKKRVVPENPQVEQRWCKVDFSFRIYQVGGGQLFFVQTSYPCHTHNIMVGGSVTRAYNK